MNGKQYIVIIEICSTTIKAAYATRKDGLLHIVALKQKAGVFMHRGILTNINDIAFHIKNICVLLQNETKQNFEQVYLCCSNADDERFYQKNKESLDTIVSLLKKQSFDCQIIKNPIMQAASLFATTEEHSKGCIYIDLGAGNTHVLVRHQGKTLMNRSIPVGGNDCTADIAKDLDISTDIAEKLKRKIGEADTTLVEDDDKTLRFNYEGRIVRFYHKSLVQRIEDRLTTDCLGLYLNPLNEKQFFDKNEVTVILSGGGSQIKNIGQLVKRLCNASQVRIADSKQLLADDQTEFHSPAYHSLLGILATAELFDLPEDNKGFIGRIIQGRKSKNSQEPVNTPKKDKNNTDKLIDNALASIWDGNDQEDNEQ